MPTDKTKEPVRELLEERRGIGGSRPVTAGELDLGEIEAIDADGNVRP